MKVGQFIESAIWIVGDEPKELVSHHKERVSTAINELCESEGFIPGPIMFYELKPENDRVPEVPEHIQGEKVRLLVAEAEIVGYKPLSSQGSFIANLDKKDLERLRKITRKASKVPLTDADCDQIIEEHGPDSALETLQHNVVVSQFH